MATFDELYAQRFPGSYQSVYEAGSEGGTFSNQFVPTKLTAENFLQMSPEERALFFSGSGVDPSWTGKNVTLWGNTPHTITGPSDPMLAALRGDFLQDDQLEAALAGTGYESLAPQIRQARSNTLAHNEMARNNDDFIHHLGIAGPLLVGAGGMLAGGLLGGTGAASASGGATAGAGTEAALGTGLKVGAGGVTGLTPGVASTGIGGGALGTGIGAGAGGAAGLAAGGAAGLGALGLGSFAGESLYPVIGGESASVGATAASAGSAAKAAGAGTALGRILDGKGTWEDYLGIAGTGLATGLGVYGAGQQADALRDIEARARADRAPFLAASNKYLADPNAYLSGPGQSSLDAVLRKLSATHGNPIDSPTALGIATQAGLADWRDAVLGFGNLGLAGEDTRANLGVKAAGADAGVLNALGYGVQQLTQPKRTLGDVLKGLV